MDRAQREEASAYLAFFLGFDLAAHYVLEQFLHALAVMERAAGGATAASDVLQQFKVSREAMLALFASLLGLFRYFHIQRRKGVVLVMGESRVALRPQSSGYRRVAVLA